MDKLSNRFAAWVLRVTGIDGLLLSVSEDDE